MQFDFDRFAIGVNLAYEKYDNHPYTIDEVLQVFLCYFKTYEAVRKEPHPMLKYKQIANIIEKMPVVLDGYVESYVYEDMIPQHFMTQYGEGCDYNINHFFSGQIRDLRFYEACY